MPAPTSNNRPSLSLQTGIPYGPGKLSVPEVSQAGTTVLYEMGDRTADRAWNGDGLNLSVEARVRAAMNGDAQLDRVQVKAGVEGLAAKINVVENGRGKVNFDGVSLSDGFFKGQVDDARDYLKENKVAAVGAAIGTLVVAHEVAKSAGPIKVDTGNIDVYKNGGFTAAVVGEVAITGDKNWIRGQGAKAKLNYHNDASGDWSLEAGYDRDSRTRVQGNWNKTFDNGVSMHANAFYEEKTKNAGVFVGVGYRF